MKYLIISDIHGSSKHLKLVLEKVSYDKIIILGDILYHGPRNNLPDEYNPKEVIEILNSLSDKIIAIRGNCDAAVDLMVLDFEIKRHLYMDINNCRFLLTHGDYYNKDNLPRKIFKYVLLHGHFHQNFTSDVNKRVKVISIGSLSIPKDNHHTYAFLEGNNIQTRDLYTDEILLNENL